MDSVYKRTGGCQQRQISIRSQRTETTCILHIQLGPYSIDLVRRQGQGFCRQRFNQVRQGEIDGDVLDTSSFQCFDSNADDFGRCSDTVIADQFGAYLCYFAFGSQLLGAKTQNLAMIAEP